MNAMSKAAAFIAANRRSPVVYGSVLTGKRASFDRTAPPEPRGICYRLQDGSVWKLTLAECDEVGQPRWMHDVDLGAAK